MAWFAIFILLIAPFALLLPPWPHMQQRDIGYGPSGIALARLVLPVASSAARAPPRRRTAAASEA